MCSRPTAARTWAVGHRARVPRLRCLAFEHVARAKSRWDSETFSVAHGPHRAETVHLITLLDDPEEAGFTTAALPAIDRGRRGR
jgi:hypothetical protein